MKQLKINNDIWTGRPDDSESLFGFRFNGEIPDSAVEEFQNAEELTVITNGEVSDTYYPIRMTHIDHRRNTVYWQLNTEHEEMQDMEDALNLLGVNPDEEETVE